MATEAGHRGEERLYEALCNLPGVTAGSVHRSVRVPLWPASTARDDVDDVIYHTFVSVEHPRHSAARCHKGEIDLVLLSPRGVFAIEVKNWSGRCQVVSCNRVGRDPDPDPARVVWRQTKTDGSVVDHPDPLGKIRRKATALAEHARNFGVDVPCGVVFPRVVLVNTNLAMDADGPGTLAFGDEVVLPHQVGDFVEAFGQTLDVQVAHAILPNWLSGSKVGAACIAELGRCISSTCRTWDELVLVLAEDSATGSAPIRGDFLGLQLAHGGKAAAGGGSPSAHRGHRREALGFSRSAFATLAISRQKGTYDAVVSWFWPSAAQGKHSGPGGCMYDVTACPRAAPSPTMAAPFGWLTAGRPVHAVAASSSAHVVFHMVGSAQPSLIPIGRVETVVHSRA